MKYSVFTACMPELTVEKAIDKLDLTGDEALGAKIVRNVLSAPLREIAAILYFVGNDQLFDLALSFRRNPPLRR